ncbi:Protein SERAC1 [Colletotrichum siamense]|uniref:Protein SERAC1 n=1 Tax=Colletotrichum siamense TaxID=690259 RepID=UPI0018722938|nr:Protein SERAC1 [Colletotrichum siamense]KAF5489265.1 Protein SERAC1 [Colletotrichum siamense]
MSGLFDRFRRRRSGRESPQPEVPATDPAPHPEIFPSGIKLLHTPDGSAAVDIVFVHGLKGHRERTWTARDASESWPKALLPTKIPYARVLTFGYDASVVEWKRAVSEGRIGNHSFNLLTSLANFRDNDETNKRPVIFVCHSMGGLVCEDALVSSRHHSEAHLRAILESTKGIVFLGTPHHGSELANWAEKLSLSIGLVKQTNTNLIRVLRRNSEVLARIQDSFHNMIKAMSKEGKEAIEITCFYEELPLPSVGLVVPQDSAILPGYIAIGIRNDHHGMTKKTQVALAYAYWLREIRPDISIFWVYASSRERFQQAFAGIAEECDIPGHKNPSVDILSLVKTWLQKEKNGLWFLVIDNADDPYLFFPQDRAVPATDFGSTQYEADIGLAHFIPECSHGSILITTRNKQAGMKLSPGRPPIEVGRMTNTESAQMIRKMTGHEDLSLETASTLSNRLESLPLALAQASAFISENSITVDQYLLHLHRGDESIVPLLSETFQTTGQDAMVPQAVMLTWMPSFEQIRKQNQLAGDLLSTIAFFDNQGITRRMLDIPFPDPFWSTFAPIAQSPIDENSCSDNELATSKGETNWDEGDHKGDESEGDASGTWDESDSDESGPGGEESKEKQLEEEDPFQPWKPTLPRRYSIPYYQSPPLYDVPLEADLSIRGFDLPRDTSPTLDNANGDPPHLIEFEKALGMLKAFSFITEGNDRTISVHRLVQLATKEWLKRDGSVERFAAQALCTFVKTFPIAVYEQMGTCKRLLPHAHTVLKNRNIKTRQNMREEAILYENLARFYFNTGQSSIVMPLLQHALKRVTKTLTDYDERQLISQMMRII